MNSSTSNGFPETILVAYAEDHSLVRDSVINFLELLGGISFIISVPSGEALIQQIQDAAIKPHVCLIDISLEGMDGFETVRILKERFKDIKLIALSGFTSREYLAQMFMAGADGYLTKNTSPEIIKRSIIDIHVLGFCNSELFTSEFIRQVIDKKIIIPQLSPKEIQFLKLCLEDMTYEELGDLIHLTTKAVEGLRRRLFEKLSIRTRAGLIRSAIQFGYIDIR